MDERRRRGLERMAEVYDFEVADGPGDFFGYTADHLFADIWNRPGLSVRDRRLMLITVLAAQGAWDVCDIQLSSALTKGDLSEEDLREVVILLAHYLGWPKGAALNTRVETVIARRQRSTD